MGWDGHTFHHCSPGVQTFLNWDPIITFNSNFSRDSPVSFCPSVQIVLALPGGLWWECSLSWSVKKHVAPRACLTCRSHLIVGSSLFRTHCCGVGNGPGRVGAAAARAVRRRASGARAQDAAVAQPLRPHHHPAPAAPAATPPAPAAPTAAAAATAAAAGSGRRCAQRIGHSQRPQLEFAECPRQTADCQGPFAIGVESYKRAL